MSEHRPKRNLVICRAGDRSLHREWMGDPASRGFDLWLDCYGDDDARFAADPAVHSIGRGTTKWPRMAALLAERESEVAGYDAVWFPDDDLSVDGATVGRMLAAFHEAGFALAQPALREGSYHSYPMLLESAAFARRGTNFVEVMAPIFSREGLARCRATFAASRSGWGLDFVWPSLLAGLPGGLGVLDDAPVLHTRPVGSGAWQAGLELAPGVEMTRIAARHGVDLPYRLRQLWGTPREVGAARLDAADPAFVEALRRGMPPTHAADPVFWAKLVATLPLPAPPAAAAPPARSGPRFRVTTVRGTSPSAAAPAPAPDAPTAPCVSVVIPCYKQAEYLPFALSSLALQTLTDWEAIVVDDGSPDDTSAVAHQMAERIGPRRVRVHRQANAGLAEARNAGIRLARGRYILPLDCDDAIDARYLEGTVALLESSGADIVGTDMMVFGARQGSWKVDPCAGLKALLAENRMVYCSLYRREAWEAVGGYNPNMTAGYEDWDFWVGCAERGLRFAHLREPLFYYREKQASMLTTARRWDRPLRARLVLNHPRCYSVAELEAAGRILAEQPLPPMKAPSRV